MLVMTRKAPLIQAELQMTSVPTLLEDTMMDQQEIRVTVSVNHYFFRLRNRGGSHHYYIHAIVQPSLSTIHQKSYTDLSISFVERSASRSDPIRRFTAKLKCLSQPTKNSITINLLNI